MTGNQWKWALFAVMFLTGAGLALYYPQQKATGRVGLEAFVAAGVTGHWAVDCARAQSVENPHVFYEVPVNGPPVERLVMDRIHDRTTPLEEIRELEGGFLEWKQKTPGGQVTVVTKFEPQRQKTWSSSLADGTVLISDGKYSGGGEAPWFFKCN